jgi:hypothetical protein
MASGFVILSDGRCLAVRSAIHDAVLRAITSAIQPETSLSSWLGTQVPDEGDADLGYAFVRASDGTTITRLLDTRGLTEANRRSFERAARTAAPMSGAYAPEGDVESALNRLRLMLDMRDQGRPPLELSDWTVEASPCEMRLGPGWT